ncbi:hypothetical protein K1719_033651 [Acacia pycnantha]|nr:hypothetical protein K1719_033651 [Acacia pycnantha]
MVEDGWADANGSAFLEAVEELGAGEILLNCIDCDGQGNGFDVDLVRLITDAVSIPVTASSGAGAVNHFFEVLAKTNASAALAVCIFHRKKGLPIAMTPNTDALGQLLFEYSKCDYTSQLQHLKDIAGMLATEEAEDVAQVTSCVQLLHLLKTQEKKVSPINLVYQVTIALKKEKKNTITVYNLLFAIYTLFLGNCIDERRNLECYSKFGNLLFFLLDTDRLKKECEDKEYKEKERLSLPLYYNGMLKKELVEKEHKKEKDTWREQVIGGKLREITEVAKSFAIGKMVLAVLLVHTPAVGSSLNCNFGWMTGLGASLPPNTDALGQCLYSSTAVLEALDALLASLISLDGILKQIKDITGQANVVALSSSKRRTILASLDVLTRSVPSLLEIDHPCAQNKIADALRMFEDRLKKECEDKEYKEKERLSLPLYYNGMLKKELVEKEHKKEKDTWREQVIGGKLREITEVAKSFAIGKMVLAVLLVHTPAVGSSLNCNFGWMTGLGASLPPNTDALGQCLYSSTAVLEALDALLASLISLDGILKQIKDITGQANVVALSSSKRRTILASLDVLTRSVPSLLEIDHPCAQNKIADALRMFEEMLKKELEEKEHKKEKFEERTRQRSQEEKAYDHLDTIIKDTWRQ